MAPQVAGARAVLGSAVRATQQAEVKHQAAKEFFKEVSLDAGEVLEGRLIAPWTPPPVLPAAPAARARAPFARCRRSAVACPGWPRTTGWRS